MHRYRCSTRGAVFYNEYLVTDHFHYIAFLHLETMIEMRVSLKHAVRDMCVVQGIIIVRLLSLSTIYKIVNFVFVPIDAGMDIVTMNHNAMIIKTTDGNSAVYSPKLDVVFPLPSNYPYFYVNDNVICTSMYHDVQYVFQLNPFKQLHPTRRSPLRELFTVPPDKKVHVWNKSEYTCTRDGIQSNRTIIRINKLLSTQPHLKHLILEWFK